jgi:outer membrane protein assembly factor BamE (lipoprotein component of BamABCDE complex)
LRITTEPLMSRRDDYDPPRRSPNTGVVLGMCIAGAVLVLFLAGMAAILVFGGREKATGPAIESAARKTYPRDEFKLLVIGKTKDEVKAVLGAPSSTSEASDETYWYYQGVSTDPATGKTDYRAQIAFSNKTGKVVAVNFTS